MELADIIILSFLFFGAIIGAGRGLSGEILSIIKLIITAIICVFAVDMIEKNLDINIFKFGYAIFASFFSIYIFTGFFIGIILFPMVSFLRIITPVIVDKTLGFIISLFKNIVILIIASSLILKINYGLTPNLLIDSVIFKQIKDYKFNFSDLTKNIKNYNPLNYKNIKDKKANKEGKEEPDKASSTQESSPLGDKVNEIFDVIDKYKKLKEFNVEENKNTITDMEQLIDELNSE
ncbi:MAG: CvpA family protein [Rickettsiales bacterium]|nr:CvpA family protein [Rickettsiales bacterium]